MMRAAGEIGLLLVALFSRGALEAADAQRALSVNELCKLGRAANGRVLTIRGVLRSGHLGPLLEDGRETKAVRLRFTDPPKSHRRNRVLKDEQYRRLFDLANSLPNPDAPRKTYTVELVCLVKVRGGSSFDPYKESPIEIFPLRVLQISTPDALEKVSPGFGSAGASFGAREGVPVRRARIRV